MTPPDHVATTLRSLRAQAGLNSTEAAKRAHLSQSRVSRIETGTFMATADEVDALCRVYGAPAKVRRELTQIARDMAADAVSTRVTLQRGAWRTQQRIGRIEAMSKLIRGFDPSVIDGLLQTEGYIRALLGGRLAGDDLSRTVASRLERQRALGGSFQHILLMTEGALLWQIGDAAVMVAQLEHLADVATRGSGRVGVIAHSTTAPFPAPDAFHIYDSRVVILGAVHATAFIADQRDIADYEKEFAELEALASFGDDAARVILRVADSFRALL